MSNLTTPVEIDTAIAERSMLVVKAERAVAQQVNYRDHESPSYRHYFEQDKLDAAKRTYDLAVASLHEVEALYTGWPRYYHVTNANGHIHTDMYCTSCFPDTQYNWRVDLSGLSVEQVVKQEAHNACSVCMPIAPAEQRK